MFHNHFGHHFQAMGRAINAFINKYISNRGGPHGPYIFMLVHDKFFVPFCSFF